MLVLEAAEFSTTKLQVLTVELILRILGVLRAKNVSIWKLHQEIGGVAQQTQQLPGQMQLRQLPELMTKLILESEAQIQEL